MSNLNQKCFDQIFEAILNHRLEPGTRLSEEKLASIYQVSRSVIRRTLQRLAHEGIVDIRPNVGARVNKIDAGEARHILEARKMLECGLVEKLAGRLSPSHVSDLMGLCRNEQNAMSDNDPARALRYSTEFHLHLVRLVGNPLLEQFAVNLLSRSSLAVACLGRSRPEHCPHDDHPELVNALKTGDCETARDLMKAHIDHIEANLDYEPGNLTELEAILG